MTYDLVIIGGGPAGVAAGVYAARKKIKTVLITEGFGGASLVSSDIQNWIGTKSISGLELAKNFEEHLRAQEGIEIHNPDSVTKIEKIATGFKVLTKEGGSFETKTVLVATGSARKKLNVPGEKDFDGKGVVYCSTCDAPLFKDKPVAVIGGGNAGLEAVMDLLAYADKIYLLEFGASLKGDPVTQDIIRKNPKVNIITNAKTLEITGNNFVNGLIYEDQVSKEKKKLALEGVFVEIGAYPNTGIVRDLVGVNKVGEIIVDHKTQQSSQLGIWAAGDASDVIYKQNNISAGDAVKAVLNIVDFLQKS